MMASTSSSGGGGIIVPKPAQSLAIPFKLVSYLEYPVKEFEIHKAARAPGDQIGQFRQVLGEVTNGYGHYRKPPYKQSSKDDNDSTLKERIPNADTRSILDVLSSWDLNKFTVLHYAVQLGHEKILRCILDVSGTQVASVNDYVGRSALHWATHLGRYDLLKELCHAKAGIITQDRFGWTPLHYLCASKNARDPHKAEEVVKAIDILVADKSLRGEPLKIWLARDLRKRTPLHLAARYGVTEQVFEKLLSLDHDARFVRMRDIRGWNVLHWATFAGQINLVGILLKVFGGNEGRMDESDIKTVDKLQLTPLDITERAKESSATWAKDMIRILKEHIANNESAPPPGQGYSGSAANVHESAAKENSRDENPPNNANSDKGNSLEQECLVMLKKYVEERAGMKFIFQQPHPESVALEECANSLAKIGSVFPADFSSSGEFLRALGLLLLYDRIVLIDDSASVGYSGGRRKALLNVLRNLGEINQRLNALRNLEDKNQQNVDFRFANRQEKEKESNIEEINNHNFDTTSVIGTGLWNRIVKPLDEQGWTLQRPLLVTILTDGEIDPVEADILLKSIQYVGRNLKKKFVGGTKGAIFFQFIDINDSDHEALDFKALRTMLDDPGLGVEVNYYNWTLGAWEFSKIKKTDAWEFSKIKKTDSDFGNMAKMMLDQVAPKYANIEIDEEE